MGTQALDRGMTESQPALHRLSSALDEGLQGARQAVGPLVRDSAGLRNCIEIALVEKHFQRSD
jgi:hypothetical protein